MGTLRSPIDGPAGWTLTSPGPLAVPDGLRYAGTALFELRAQRTTVSQLRMPADGALRAVTPAAGEPAAGRTFLEIEVNPFALRHVAQGLAFGLPTFYLVLDAGVLPVPFEPGDVAPVGERLADVTAVSVLCAGQDRVARDPARWAAEILAAIVAAAADDGGWRPFAEAVASQTAGGANPPVLLLDHRGAPRASAIVEITSSAGSASAIMTSADGGDLQRTVARMHADDPGAMTVDSVFGSGGGPVTLRPSAVAPGDVQLAAVEGAGALSGAGEIALTPSSRHVAFTDLTGWFAPQFAAPPPPFAQLARFTRDNAVTPLVNGIEYYDHLFRRLQDAVDARDEGGLHLAGGWQTFPDTKLAQRPAAGDPYAGMPATLEQAATWIGAANGRTRFLSPKFFQLESGSNVELTEILVFSFVVFGLLRAKGTSLVRSDAGGAVILIALFVANAILVTWLIDTNGQAVEPNKDAVEILDPIAGAESRYAPHPASIEDNPDSPPLGHFPWTELFKLMRNFGTYHQKFAIVKAGGERFGYCGGIDLNPNRLDDARHLAVGPYHDVHALIQGPAVRDLELSFSERWARDGGQTELAFPPSDAGAPAAGGDAVQIARTYFKAADPSRALAFAPDGDRTIADTLLRAIGEAREFISIEDQYFTLGPGDAYREALLAKVGSGDIHTLLVTLPAIGDQPFGELVRSGFIADLRAADAAAGGGIVRIGYPRRHYTLPDNELRAASGRLVLMDGLAASGGVDPTVVLGPKQRLPQVPFWLAIEGELMYVFDESTAPNPDPDHAKVFAVVRGDDTHLVRGGAAAAGSRTRTHPKNAAATVVDLASIYVHAKTMIVDDVFACIGSANVNRRGHFHDGEINVFTVPQALKTARENPVAALRRRLWAELLDLPPATAQPLLEDPLAAVRLFDRSPLLGNRFTDIEAYPTHLMFDATSADGLVLDVLKLILVTTPVALDHAELFRAVIDPTSAVESA